MHEFPPGRVVPPDALVFALGYAFIHWSATRLIGRSKFSYQC
jgi:hypothetical protein